MKFVVIQKIRSHASIKEITTLLPEQIKYYEELLKSRRVESFYHMIGLQGHMIICDVESDDELSSIVERDPLFFQSQREVYPLTTPNTHKKYVQELIGNK